MRMKSSVFLFFVLSFCVLLMGCGSENNDISKIGKTASKVAVCDDDKMCFILNDKKIMVDDELHSATSITNTVWIDDENLGVTCHVNPSLEYFTVYNKQQEDFIFAAYGVDFLWKDNTVESIVYVETPAHFAVTDESYRIINYSGDILFSSNDEISDLQYNDNQIAFKVTKNDGSISDETVQCGK